MSLQNLYCAPVYRQLTCAICFNIAAYVWSLIILDEVEAEIKSIYFVLFWLALIRPKVDSVYFWNVKNIDLENFR